jgi:hypothetical protein
MHPTLHTEWEPSGDAGHQSTSCHVGPRHDVCHGLHFTTPMPIGLQPMLANQSTAARCHAGVCVWSLILFDAALLALLEVLLAARTKEPQFSNQNIFGNCVCYLSA